MKTIKYILTINFILCIAFTIMAQGIVVITGNETWTSNQDIDYGIQIEPGAVLTIESTIRFAPDAKLIVKRGGKLIVDGGVLTNLNSNSLWPGIEVWGRSDKSQYSSHPNGYLYQGKASFTNGALVMNAFIGVLAGKTDDEFDYKNIDGLPIIPIQPGFTGGIIMAHSSEFRNNKIGVYLPEYENFHPVNDEPRDNLSYFKNCNFYFTSTIIPDIDPEAFIKLVGVSGILTEGNHFINTYLDRQITPVSGIISLNSSFKVLDYCLDLYQPCQNVRISKFEDLGYGIMVLGTETNESFLVDSAYFNGNVYGIYSSGINDFIVIRNQFLAGFVGIRIDDDAAGFRIEENVFDQFWAGIIFLDTGEARNTLYKNWFEDNYISVLSQGNNRDANSSNGLTIRCNEFNNGQQDILVLPHGTNNLGIAPYQGSPAPLPDAPAGNIFSWHSPKDSDIRNLCEHIYYYYHGIKNGEDRLEPKYISGVTKIENEAAAWEINSCPSNINPPGGGFNEGQLRFLIADANQQAEAVNTVINALKDAGDTDALYWNVSTSAPWQSLEVYNELMSSSPYISNKVLASAIEKENVLIDAMIRNILVANPHSAKNNELLDLLEQRLQPLPEYMWDEILEGRDIVSVFENLQATFSYYRNKEAEYQKQLIHMYLNDNTAAAKDSIIKILLADNSLHQWYQAAFIRQEQGNNVAALDILNSIPATFSLDSEKLTAHNDIITFVSKAEALRQQGISIYLPDSTTVAWLLDMMDNGSEPASNYARNILVAHSIVEYEPEIPLPDFNKSDLVKHRKRSNVTQQDEVIILHPNPAKDFVIINYDIQDLNLINAQALLTVTGIEGKVIETLSLQKNKDQVVFQLSDYTPGTYIISIYYSNRIIETKRLIIH